MATTLREGIAIKGASIITPFKYGLVKQDTKPNYAVFRFITKNENFNTKSKYDELYLEIKFFGNSISECEDYTLQLINGFNNRGSDFDLNDSEYSKILRLKYLNSIGAFPIGSFWQTVLQFKIDLLKK